MKKFLLIFAVAVLGVAQNAGAQLPAITIKTIDGKDVRVDTLRNNGRPFVIDFFATWCKPCNRELDAISEVYEDWQEETGMKIFAISVDQAHNVNKVKPLVDSHGWDYDIFLDTNSDLLKALGIQAIPYTLVFDGNGKIIARHNGYKDGEEEELIEEVRQLVK